MSRPITANLVAAALAGVDQQLHGRVVDEGQVARLLPPDVEFPEVLHADMSAMFDDEKIGMHVCCLQNLYWQGTWIWLVSNDPLNIHSMKIFREA